MLAFTASVASGHAALHDVVRRGRLQAGNRFRCAIWAYVDVADAVQAFELALVAPVSGFDIYNIGAAAARPLRVMVK